MNRPLLARSGLSLDRLASFVAVADAGGLSAAARGVAVRQSQLSRQLKELEEFFGTPLVERRRGAFRLAAAGRTLLEIARGALTRLEDFERQCAGELTEVHIGAGESALVWLLTPRLGPLLETEPKVAFTLHNLQSGEIVTRLRDGRLDFGILRQTDVGSGLEGLTLGRVSYALLVPATALARGPREPLRQLLNRLPLAVLEGGGAVHDALAAWAAGRGVTLNVRLRCTSLVQAAAAVGPLGVAAVLPTWAAAAFAPGRVAQVRLPFLSSLEAPLRLVWSRRQLGVRPFLDGLAREIGQILARR
jgi:DNA-binding transcriptional LysR family regulator